MTIIVIPGIGIIVWREKNSRIIFEFFSCDRKIRKLMISAQYTHITNEYTTMWFIIDGLSSHSQFFDIQRHIRISGLPASLNDLQARLEGIAKGKARKKHS